MFPPPQTFESLLPSLTFQRWETSSWCFLSYTSPLIEAPQMQTRPVRQGMLSKFLLNRTGLIMTAFSFLCFQYSRDVRGSLSMPDKEHRPLHRNLKVIVIRWGRPSAARTVGDELAFAILENLKFWFFGLFHSQINACILRKPCRAKQFINCNFCMWK